MIDIKGNLCLLLEYLASTVYEHYFKHILINLIIIIIIIVNLFYIYTKIITIKFKTITHYAGNESHKP